jgi:hypothetical protein
MENPLVMVPAGTPAITDCDIHKTAPTDAALGQLLSERCPRHLDNYAIRF